MAMVTISVGVLTTPGELTSPSLLPYSLAEQNLESLARKKYSSLPSLISSHFTHLQLDRPPTEMESQTSTDTQRIILNGVESEYHPLPRSHTHQTTNFQNLLLTKRGGV